MRGGADADGSISETCFVNRTGNDTFYLNEPVQLLQTAIAPLGYDAKITLLSGRTHFDLFNGGLMTRIAAQMYETARPGRRWTPSTPPDPATELAK
jgi:hypothetical protein